MNRYTVFLLLSLVNVIISENVDKVNDVEDARAKSDDVLWDMMNDCVSSEVDSLSTCLKLKVSYILY